MRHRCGQGGDTLMRELAHFRDLVRAHRRALGRTQQELARAIGLHPNVLSHKLHGRDGATLTQADVVAIIRTLAAWGALTTRVEAHALLALMSVPPHALPASAWAVPPLADLAPAEAAPAGAQPVSPASSVLSAPAPATPAVPGPPRSRPSLLPLPLPEPAMPLIGRVEERAAVHAALAAARLVTLTGVGGTGKTRLALQVAHEAVRGVQFADGVAFVDLAPLRDAALLPLRLIEALGLPAHRAASPEAQLSEALRARHLLLVVDNLEHLLEEAPLLGRLLAAAPHLHVLATSRVPLRLYGEQEIRVPPLPLPMDGAGEPSDPTRSEAVQLFVARAGAVSPGFAPTGAALAAVAAICAALDGLPLAIELAAARIKLFPPEALLPRLGARLALLTDGPRDRPERQRTMRAALDWSYALLTPAEGALFACLGVFAGPFDADAAAAVHAPGDAGSADGPSAPEAAVDHTAGDQQTDLMLGRLASLADQGLLEVTSGPTPRFRMLVTVRAYALARLAEGGAQEIVQRRHVRYYLALAEAAEPALTGPEQGAWLARLSVEHDNLRAALAWALVDDDTSAQSALPYDPRGCAALGLRLAGALWRFWRVRGYLSEGRAWLDAALARPPARGGTTALSDAAARVKALRGASVLARDQGDYRRATALGEDALALSRQTEDAEGIAGALNGLGVVAYLEHDPVRAQALQEESLAVYRARGQAPRVAVVLNNLGLVAQRAGDNARAMALYAESLALKRTLGDTRGIATSLHNLGVVALEQGDLERAVPLFAESLTLKHGLGNMQGIAASLDGLAEVAGTGGQARRAARLLGAAAALRVALDARPKEPLSAQHYGRAVASVRAALGEKAFAAAWAEGEGWTPEQAVADALALAPAVFVAPSAARAAVLSYGVGPE